jgi:hypothetical protein
MLRLLLSSFDDTMPVDFIDTGFIEKDQPLDY